MIETAEASMVCAMVRHPLSFWKRAGHTAAILMVAGAAAPTDFSLRGPEIAPLPKSAPALPPKRLTFQNTMYAAAPMPDPDAGPPSSSAAPTPQVAPKFMSPRSLFQGDGYAYASSEQGTLDRRKTPAAGLGLSVPMQ